MFKIYFNASPKLQPKKMSVGELYLDSKFLTKHAEAY